MNSDTKEKIKILVFLKNLLKYAFNITNLIFQLLLHFTIQIICIPSISGFVSKEYS